jgi:hypothetical protein
MDPDRAEIGGAGLGQSRPSHGAEVKSVQAGADLGETGAVCDTSQTYL